MKFTEVNVNVGFCFCLRFYNFLFFHLHSAAMYFSDIQNLFHFRKLWFLPTSHQLWGFPSGKLEKEKLSESRRVLLHSVKKRWRRQRANVIIEKTIINTYLPFSYSTVNKVKARVPGNHIVTDRGQDVWRENRTKSITLQQNTLLMSLSPGFSF